MTTVILFVLGAIVGSFLNVVGLRFNSGATLLGRSRCFSCGKTLRWFELIPILSFFFLQGRCRSCRAAISWQYPTVEFWTALIFVTLPYLYLPAFSLFVAIVIYDVRHKIIPDALVYLSIAYGAAVAVFLDYSLIDWLTGPIMFAFFALVWILTAGKAMGFGDAKLALSIGILLGAAEGLSAVIVAFWMGALFGIAFLVLHRFSLWREAKQITMKSEVPFAPFMVIGAWIAAVLQLDLLHVSLL